MQNTAIFETVKSEIFFFVWKKIDIFLFIASNIDCGYMLEPPQWGGSNEYPGSMF